jgi:ribose transport system substrate-binding protein
VQRRSLSALTVSALIACGGAAGCGETSPGPGGGEAASAAATEPGGGAAVDKIKAEIGRFQEIPRFEAPGPAFDISGAKGKKVLNIPASSANPFLASIDEGMREVARRAGIEWIQYENQGDPADWGRGIDQAVTQRADVIVLNAPDANLLAPQLRRARKAGIKVVSAHLYDEEMEHPEEVDAFSFAPFIEAAELEAKWTIADSDGKADVLLVSSNDFDVSPVQRDAMLEVFEQRCPECRTKVVDVPSKDWAAKVQTTVQSALLANPKITHVIPFYDSMAQFVGAALQSASNGSKVKVVTFNGTPSILKMLQDEKSVVMDVGEDPRWIGWQTMDQVMRVMTGEPVVRAENAMRIFDETNVDEAGTPPKLGEGYGDAYVSGFEELWGLSGR